MLSKVLFQCVLLLSFCTLNAEIWTIHSLQNLLEQSLDQDTLILLDLDQTLLFSDLAIHQPQAKKYRLLFDQFAEMKLSAKSKEDWVSRVILKEKLCLIEANTPELIEKLKKTKAKVIALTARKTGSYGQIASMENLRIEQLTQMGIHFSLFGEAMSLKHVAPDNLPVYQAGILFTDLLPKDVVLKEWLLKQAWTPKKILFVDDQLFNLQLVQALADSLKIPFIGYYYQGINQLELPLRKELIELQFSLFLETGHWPRDDELESFVLGLIDFN